MGRLGGDVKITNAITTTAGASGISVVLGGALDMVGYRSVLMVVTFGPITAGATTSINAQQSDTAAFGSPEDLLGTLQTVADNDDDKVFYIDIHRPSKRYVRLRVFRGVQAATIGSALYLQYDGRKFPAVHGTGVAGESFTGPIEGTP